MLATMLTIAGQLDASLDLAKIQVGLDRDQYEDVLLISDNMSRFASQQVHKHLR